jgi:N6-L-threonylcarbamoyladenine synthase
MEGHIYASVLTTTSEDEYQINQFMLPAVALLISGGHTELIHITDMHQYKKVGQTLDDAAGEAFDKAARSMGLQYPGGPEISKKSSVARQKSLICKDELRLPRPMLHSGDLNFSFSGLKTAVLYALKKHTLDEDEKLAFCMEFENAITDVLIKKTSEALYLYNAKSLIVGGGVSANSHIREKLQQLADEESIDLHLPTKNLSTDNALMIAAIAVARIQHGYAPTDPASVVATPNLSLETV